MGYDGHIQVFDWKKVSRQKKTYNFRCGSMSGAIKLNIVFGISFLRIFWELK